MKDTFLHFHKIPSPNNHYELSELADYYCSGALNEVIFTLIHESINPDQIQDKKVLLKPNWVKHSTAPEDQYCMRTNDNFVIATLKIILEMRPSKVVIGDAPIQGCNWGRMISGAFLDNIYKLSKKNKIPIEIKDFRRRIYSFSDNNPESENRPLSDYVIFNLGKESFLEPITEFGPTNFRVTNYDPDRMSSAHSPGVHKYCIVREFFDSDLVISLPKIKTHQKTGITGALKNLVGINGDKDFLPHHRIGGTKFGGDCYPGGSLLRYWSELSLDKANRKQGKKNFWFWQKLSSLLWMFSFPGPEYNLAAGWCGNDTTWRMVMDLNKIAMYGQADGTLSDNPQRQIFSLCDGIIAGQGDGPLEPKPLALGLVSFTNDSFINDKAMAMLMDLPVERIPLLNSVLFKEKQECEIFLDGERIIMEDLRKYSEHAIPPIGWADYFKRVK